MGRILIVDRLFAHAMTPLGLSANYCVTIPFCFTICSVIRNVYTSITPNPLELWEYINNHQLLIAPEIGTYVHHDGCIEIY